MVFETEAEDSVNDKSTVTMREKKKERLAAKGWKTGSAKDFIRLTDEESAYIEPKICLAKALRDRRQRNGLSHWAKSLCTPP